jgi:hypothetical protein
LKIPMTPEVKALLLEQRRAFKKKFGRYPKGDDPIFFDPEADTPQPLKLEDLQAATLEAMKLSGTRPEIIYAYRKTGRTLEDNRRHIYPPEAVREWDQAIAEYFQLEAEHAAKPDLPKRKLGRERKVPPTDMPELLASPYTDEDKAAIFKCLDALDIVLAVTPMTVRARLEVGAVLVAMTADAAYESAIEQNSTVEDALERAALFGNLSLERAQEIFDTVRRDE